MQLVIVVLRDLRLVNSAALDDPMLERTPNGACMLRQQKKESNPKVGPKQLFFSLKIRLVRRGLGTLGLRKSTVGWLVGLWCDDEDIEEWTSTTVKKLFFRTKSC